MARRASHGINSGRTIAEMIRADIRGIWRMISPNAVKISMRPMLCETVRHFPCRIPGDPLVYLGDESAIAVYSRSTFILL